MNVAEKIFSASSELYLFTLDHTHLNLPCKHAEPSCLYKRESIQIWQAAIKRSFQGCCYYALEVGSGDFNAPRRGLVHAHIIAAKDDGPEGVKHDGRRYKPVTNLERLFTYLAKPPEPYNLEAEFDYRTARMVSDSRQVPKTRGWLRSKKRREWRLHCPSAANSHPKLPTRLLRSER